MCGLESSRESTLMRCGTELPIGREEAAVEAVVAVAVVAVAEAGAAGWMVTATLSCAVAVAAGG